MPTSLAMKWRGLVNEAALINQGSQKILPEQPEEILQRGPLTNSSIPQRILRQTYDGLLLNSICTKIDEGNYFALKIYACKDSGECKIIYH